MLLKKQMYLVTESLARSQALLTSKPSSSCLCEHNWSVFGHCAQVCLKRWSRHGTVHTGTAQRVWKQCVNHNQTRKWIHPSFFFFFLSPLTLHSGYPPLKAIPAIVRQRQGVLWLSVYHREKNNHPQSHSHLLTVVEPTQTHGEHANSTHKGQIRNQTHDLLGVRWQC